MSIYDYTVKARKGATLNLADLKGKVLLIVNTATGCGFTPQYEALRRGSEETRRSRSSCNGINQKLSPPQREIPCAVV